MKYLCLHKLFVVISLLLLLIVEMLICGLFYILYVIWNIKIPHNFWLEHHSFENPWDETQIADKNPIQTFVRRYKFIFREIFNDD